jgi:amino acid adenylation domain
MKNILEYLEAAALKNPEKTAFTDETSAITYGEAANKAKAIGSHLSKLNKKNSPIAVLMDNCACSLVAFFGVVYSGNFYVVIDSKMPSDRINVIFNTLSPIAVLTDKKHAEKAEELSFNGDVFYYEDASLCDIDEEALSRIRRRAIDTDPLYALFTSGSTGVPKGAVICHRSVIAYANWIHDTFELNENTQFGSQTPFYFSMSVLDIFSTIKHGCTLHIMPRKYFSFPVKLLQYMNEKHVNTIYWVPSALSIIANLKALDYIPLPELKKVLFAGEVMPTKQLNYWISKMPDTMFANLYGPTEITDICTYYVVDREFSDDEPLPIGKSCSNCDVMVISDDGTEASPDEEGELCVRGSFLALGYYNNEEKTSQVFVQNPLNPHYPEIIYKTGDLVKYNSRGELMYITRKDFQIKRMGYRIELGEIETAAGSIGQVKACACIYDEDKDKIVLVYEGEGLDDTDVSDVIRKKLPEYMHPNKLLRVKQMPYNQNGKIDRKHLKSNYHTM